MAEFSRGLIAHLLPLVAISPLSVAAGPPSPVRFETGAIEGLAIINSQCGYHIPESLSPRITKVRTVILRPGVLQVFIDFRQTLGSREVQSTLSFGCPYESGVLGPHPRVVTGETVPVENCPATPKQLINDQDSGGRYYRHVLWQRNFNGANWPGLAARIDYVDGDGFKQPVNQYLICHAEKIMPCMEYEIDGAAEVSAHDSDTMLRLLQDISVSAEIASTSPSAACVR